MRTVPAEALQRGDWIESYSTYVVEVERTDDGRVIVHCSNRGPLTLLVGAGVWVERER